MGTYLAMRYAIEFPNRMKGIALLASMSARGPTKYRYADMWKERVVNRPAVIAELKAHGLAAQEPPDSQPRLRWLHYRITQGALYLYDVRKWREMQGTFFYSFKAAEAAKTMPAEWDYREKLSSLSAPILIMMGDDDYIELEQNKQWAAGAKNVQFKIVPKAGHNLWIDQRRIFRDELSSFLHKASQAQ
jgi:pimeloyl-ACP methyl ester carboxylesterase